MIDSVIAIKLSCLEKQVEELEKENQKYKKVIDKLNDYMSSGYLINTKDIKDILKGAE